MQVNLAQSLAPSKWILNLSYHHHHRCHHHVFLIYKILILITLKFTLHHLQDKLDFTPLSLTYLVFNNTFSLCTSSFICYISLSFPEHKSFSLIYILLFYPNCPLFLMANSYPALRFSLNNVFVLLLCGTVEL